MGGEKRYPAALALEVFLEMLRRFDPLMRLELRDGRACLPDARCGRIAYAGSLRRRRPDVGDLEILYVPKMIEEPDPMDLFGGVCGGLKKTDDTLRLIDGLVAEGIIAKRLNKAGAVTSWGEQNRYAVHVATGLPIDFFGTTWEFWANYMVCRTGPDTSNTAICNAALARGLNWCPYEGGFRRGGTGWDDAPERHTMRSEREVFQFVGLPWREPWERLKE